MGRKQKPSKIKDRAYRPYDRKDIQIKKRKGKGKMNSFVWSISQETCYVQFLKDNKSLFTNAEERKKSRVFVLMSQYLQKRGPDQCRSHHQKMCIKYGSVDIIIQKITEDKLSGVNASENEEFSSSNFKLMPGTSTQIKEQKNQAKNQEEIMKEMVCISVDFQEFDKKLWECVSENAWINRLR